MREFSPKVFNATKVAVLALALFFCPAARANQFLALAWNPSTSAGVVGYKVYFSTDRTNFDNAIDVGTNTSATVNDLQPGTTNEFEVVAYNIDGIESPPSNLLEYSVPGTAEILLAQTNITLLIGGNGSLLQNLKGKVFHAGDRYTLTAAPARGSVFTGWVSNGIVVSTTPSFTFLLKSNVVLQANFMPNPFIPAVGAYRGLYYVPNDTSVESSGSFSASVTSAGAFTARFGLGAANYSYAGVFHYDGTTAVKSFPRARGLTPIQVQLQLDLSGGAMTGTISDGTWTANLAANPAIYSRTNFAPQAGKYTMLIPGIYNSSGQPAGNGFASVTVNTLGAVSLSGTMGDGSGFISSSVVGSEGQWPFYVSLYGGKGSMLGWLTFATNGDINGQIDWFKTPQTTAKLYPGGFTNSTEVVGSTYKYTNGLPILDFADDGTLSLINGDLAESITNQVGLGILPVTESCTNKLTVMNASGMFHGTVINPATKKPIAVSGIVLQKQNYGAGYFLGTNQCGSVSLSGPP